MQSCSSPPAAIQPYWEDHQEFHKWQRQLADSNPKRLITELVVTFAMSQNPQYAEKLFIILDPSCN